MSTVFEGVDAKSRKVRQLALSDYAKLVAPVAHLIRLKMEQMEGIGELLDKHKELLKRLGEAIDTKSSDVATDALLGDIALLERDINKVARPLAFRDHDEETQRRFMASAEFADEWFSFGSGHKTLYLRSWYICFAEECGAAISSKVWEKRLADPWAKKQDYYCVACWRRYNRMWGQVVESKLKPTDTPCFSLAPIPPKAIEDIRAMNLELTLKLDTPMDLYNSLKQYSPTPGGVFRLSKS